MRSQQTVFHVINSLGTGGAEQFVVNMLRFHSRERYLPICICLREPQNNHNERLVTQMGVPLYFLRISNTPLAWLHNRLLNQLFQHYRPSVVHTHLSGIRYTLPLAIKHRTPVRVHTLHTLAEQEIGTRANRFVRMVAFRYRFGGFVPVAIADEVARTIERVYHYKNPPVIPNGIPVQDYLPDPDKRLCFRAQHQIEPHAIIIVHVGRFAHSKNHALLLRAFSQIRSEHPLYLWLVGDGELRASMENYAQELGIAPRVRFWGVRTDVAEILNAADIFTLPSRYEGNPMSLMEAMASELPVVATAVGGIAELVQDGVSGLLTPNEDLDALTAALARLVNDPDLRYAIGAAALQCARERFDIRHTVNAYEALYEEIRLRRSY